MNLERRRQTLALLVSLLVHALLLSLTFGGQGLGLPGFGLPWQARRAEAPALRVVLVPAQAAAPAALQPLQEAPDVQVPAAMARPLTAATIPPLPTPAAPVAAVAATPAPAALRSEPPTETSPPPAPKPAVIALARPDDAAWVVPAAPAPSAPIPDLNPNPDSALQEARERAAELARLDRARQEAREQAAQQDAARQDAARREAERQDAARQSAARQEAVRQDAAREEAARAELAQAEAARLEAQRQEAARQAAARQEKSRQDAARQESARAEAERLDNERQQAARQAAARQDAARQDAARQEAARNEAATKLADARAADIQAAAESREAKLRAIGRQLNEEADRRDAAAAAAAAAARQSPSTLPATSSSARRGRLFGRTDANAELVLYAEAWSRKIQLNMGFDMVREAAKQPHSDPLVTVAIRSDGSVESVSFVRSSGVPAIDEAIRRIVLSQANYPAFQPALAREYDVVEIRRTWHFDMAIRLY